MSCFKDNGDFLDDIWLRALERQRKREYFMVAVEPIYREIARIHGLYDQITMVIHPDGSIEDRRTLPDFAQKYIDKCKEAIEVAASLSEGGRWPI